MLNVFAHVPIICFRNYNSIEDHLAWVVLSKVKA